MTAPSALTANIANQIANNAANATATSRSPLEPGCRYIEPRRPAGPAA